MADYKSIFQPYYLNGWENQPSENTPIMGEALDAYDDTLKSLESFLAYQLPVSVGYSIYPFLYADGTLRISLLDRYGSELSRNDVNLGGMITGLSFEDGILTATYKSGDTKDVDITSLLDMIVPDITTTDSTTQPNSHAGREMVLEIGGVTVQDSTAGNQLWNGKYVTNALNKEQDDFVADSTMAGNTRLPVMVGKQYTLSKNGALTGMRYAFKDIDGNNITSLTNASTTAPAPEGATYMIWRVNGYHAETDEIMLNEGTTALPYEKYTGGQPAPNPYYPMPIKNSRVKGIRTHHKNFFGFEKSAIDITDEIRGTSKQRVNISKINDNEIRCDYDKGSYCYGYIAINGVDGTKDWSIKYTLKENTTTYTITVKKNSNLCTKDRLVLQINGGNNSENVESGNYFVLTDIMVSEEDAEYEAYRGTEITFSQPIELYGMGDVQDVIAPQENKRRFVKVVIDGSDEEAWSKEAGLEYVFRLRHGLSNVIAYSENQLCTHLLRANSYNNLCDKEGYFAISSNAILVNISGITTSPDLRSFLAENPITFVFDLSEETTEELPISDQIGLNSLLTYDGVTYVEFIYEGLEPTFKGKYGTSEVGGMTLESLLVARNNDLRLTAVESAVVNNL